MYTKEFKEAFKKLNEKLTTEQLAEVMKRSVQEIRRIRRELGL